MVKINFKLLCLWVKILVYDTHYLTGDTGDHLCNFHVYLLQAALVIRGFGIRGFGIRGFVYSRMQKPQIARENCYFVPKLGLF